LNQKIDCPEKVYFHPTKISLIFINQSIKLEFFDGTFLVGELIFKDFFLDFHGELF